MNFFVSMLVLLFTYLLQTTLAGYIKLWGIKPDMLFTAVLCYAILEGREKAAVMGLGAGLLLDFLWGRSFGVNALLYLLVSVLCAITAENMFYKNVALAVLSVFLFSLVYGLAYSAIFFEFAGKGGLGYLFVRVALPSAVYNSLIAIPVFAIMDRLRRRYGRDNF